MRPSVPGNISTKAPNSAIFRTVPSVDLPDLRLAGERLDHRDGRLHRLAVGRLAMSTRPESSMLIEAPGAGDDVLDHLAARPDDVLDELGTDL